MENKAAVGTAIGKIILMGEHSVVYGEPALAIPFSTTKIETTIYKKSGPVILDCFFYNGILSNAPERLRGLTIVIKEVVKSFNEELIDFNINIESSIPPERGMGSSAAVSVATIRALYKYFDYPLTEADLIKWTNISEKIIHGNPSGIDAAVIIGERSLYYIKGKEFVPFDFKLDAYLIVADTGEVGQTREAVESVKKLIESHPQKSKSLIGKLGILANKAKKLMESNNPMELGKIMTRAHGFLDELGVSNYTLNGLVNTALNNGALGAKLTGGGRGGCMIALAFTEEEAKLISQSLLDNGAKNTWIYNMGVDII